MPSLTTDIAGAPSDAIFEDPPIALRFVANLRLLQELINVTVPGAAFQGGSATVGEAQVVPDQAHGNSVVFSDSPSVPETAIHLSVELQQVRPRKTSPDALSRNVLPTRFWSRMLGAPGRRRANASSKPSASI
jgi:hypothetical protein